MTKEDDAALSILQFDEKEIEKWRICTLSYFNKKGWLDLLESSKPNAQPTSKTTSTAKIDATGTMPDEENAAATDFKKRDAEAMDFIILKISDKYLFLVSTKNNTHEMWNAIITSFYRTSKEVAAIVHAELFAMKYAGNSLLSLKEFLQEFVKKVQMLKNLGGRLTDEDLMRQLLHVLPSEFITNKAVNFR